MSVSSSAPGWHGPGGEVRRRRKFKWSRLLWSLVWPRGGERIVPTVPGVILIGLSFGVGTAAYNSSSNILFITLSLLLACLILSGVLSWLNFRRLSWRLEVAAPWRVGQTGTVGLALRNEKTFLPTYGLGFEWVARAAAAAGGAATVESTITGKGIDVRAALKQAQAAEARGSVALGGRLDPRGETRLDWNFAPAKRGRLRVELASVGSLFPFGFLKKQIGTELRHEVVVWPAPVVYRQLATGVARQAGGIEPVVRRGSGGDLLALRRYVTGDSHRLIHWKASARTRQLLVREFSAESSEGLALWLRTAAQEWPRAEQFELLLGFAATLAEDLFRAGHLKSVALDDEPPAAVRHVRDLEGFLDRLAVAETTRRGGIVSTAATRKNLLTFAADGAHGVAAFINGNKAATA